MKRIFRPTLFITGLNLASLVFSFVLQLVVAAAFGARSEMDAYLAAFVLPSVINAILLGSIGFVFIPIFIQHRSNEGQQYAWQTSHEQGGEGGYLASRGCLDL